MEGPWTPLPLGLVAQTVDPPDRHNGLGNRAQVGTR